MKIMSAKIIAIFLLLGCGRFASGVTLTLPDESQTITLTALINEQADVSVPASVIFNVTDVSQGALSAEYTISATNVVLEDGKKLRIEIIPTSEEFTPPVPGATTYQAGNVGWNSPTWVNGDGHVGALDIWGYYIVADMSSANASELSTTQLKFALGPNSAVNRAGNHTLSATWKFSSL